MGFWMQRKSLILIILIKPQLNRIHPSSLPRSYCFLAVSHSLGSSSQLPMTHIFEHHASYSLWLASFHLFILGSRNKIPYIIFPAKMNLEFSVYSLTIWLWPPVMQVILIGLPLIWCLTREYKNAGEHHYAGNILRSAPLFPILQVMSKPCPPTGVYCLFLNGKMVQLFYFLASEFLLFLSHL